MKTVAVFMVIIPDAPPLVPYVNSWLLRSGFLATNKSNESKYEDGQDSAAIFEIYFDTYLHNSMDHGRNSVSMLTWKIL